MNGVRADARWLLLCGAAYVASMQLASGLGLRALAGQTIVAAGTLLVYAALLAATRRERRWPGIALALLSGALVLLAVLAAGLGTNEPRLLASALVAAAFHTFAFTLARRRLRATRRP